MIAKFAYSFVVADYGRSLMTLCDAPYLFVLAINDYDFCHF